VTHSPGYAECCRRGGVSPKIALQPMTPVYEQRLETGTRQGGGGGQHVRETNARAALHVFSGVG